MSARKYPTIKVRFIEKHFTNKDFVATGTCREPNLKSESKCYPRYSNAGFFWSRLTIASNPYSSGRFILFRIAGHCNEGKLTFHNMLTV